MASRAPFSVIGATGKTGRRVVERLQARGLACAGFSRGSETPFAWDDPATWPAVLRAAACAYVSYVPDLAVEGSAKVIAQLASTARDHGVRRMILLSGRNEPSAQRAEAALLSILPESTIVRASWFFQNFNEGQFAPDVAAGELALPVTAVREPFIDADDIAAVAVEAMVQRGHEGRIHELTGPQLLSFSDIADIVTRLAPAPLSFRTVSIDTFMATLAAAGCPPDFADLLRQLFTEVLDGRSESVTNGVVDVLGRPPRRFEEFLVDAVRQGRWPTAAADRPGAALTI